MLIAMAVYDTEENNRSWMTQATLESLYETVDWDKHRLIVVDNASCDETQQLYGSRQWWLTLIRNDRNLGTAAAINQAWKLREAGEHCVKMDNDVVFHQNGWTDWIEDVFDRDSSIGICGLKRKDLGECPWGEGPMQSALRMLPHERGQRWLVVEEVKHVMGTCQGFSSALLDEIGYLYQPGLYGFDDSLASIRAAVAGFKRVFLCGFEIDHIDPGGDTYCAEKKALVTHDFPEFNALVIQYEAGVKPVYYDGGFPGAVSA